MKLKLSLVLLLVFVQFSCNKWLELLPPEGLTRDQFWKTKEDVESVMMGAYASFSTMDGLLFKYGEMRGDMVKGNTSQALDEQKIMQGNIYPDNSLCDWTKFYNVILYCNEVIKNAPGVKLKDNTFTDYQLQGYLSEAYFLRSLTYFYLVRIFKDVPLVLEPTESDMDNFYPVKTDGDTIIAHIMSDLKGVRNYASTDYPTTKATKGRATRAAIDALLADISLWTFDYNSCLTYIANIEATNTYKLMPSDLWFTMYYPGNSLESIFELQYNDGLGQKNSTFGLTNQNAYNYIPSNEAVTLFTQTDNNRELVRGLGSIAKISTNNYIIWKYVGMSPDGQSVRPGSIQNSCGWIVYRYGDILLMKAEALSQLGRYSEALDAINLIRTRAGVPQLIDVANSASDYENAILTERSLELAFEGKRWYDLSEWGGETTLAENSTWLISL